MLKMAQKPTLSKTLSCGTAMVIVAMMAVPAIAQETTGQQTTGTSTSSAPPPQGSDDTVIVVGTRASQQSAIDRKKKAKTAQDSIVADDVGSFPDRNLNEAISRISGTAITRNAFGEGDGVSVRGNGPDLTRVEMDGMGVMASGADLAIGTSNQNGRSADMRELPADLIKSVDVVKGQTADMTEGGLGATILIKTRSGLDFKKPYTSLRVGAQTNSLSRTISPDINFVASRKFLNDRLGVLFNLSSSRVLNDSHAMTNGGTNNRQGYSRFVDLDNSPNKTFSFNPDLTNGDTALLASPLAVGTGTFNSATAREVLAKSAAANTKAECLTAFPLLTATQLNSIQAGTNNATRASAQAQRINEQITCLNQWNDYTPTLIRDQMYTQYEDRLAVDIRFDYKVNDRLTVYAKYAIADRNQQENNRQRTRGGVSSAIVPTAGIATQSLVNNTNIPIGTINTLSAVPNSGYAIFNGLQPSAPVTLDSTLAGSTVNNAFPTYGIAVNFDPTSLVVDANHHLTSVKINNASVSIDHIRNDQIWKNNYLLLGGIYKGGPLNVEFQASRGEASYSRYDKRASRGYVYGSATMRVTPSGIWTFDLPDTYDETDMTKFVVLNAATAADQPRFTNALTIQYNPRLTESEETNAKIDASYRLEDKIPFFTNFKTGASYRETGTSLWTTGGGSPVLGVTLPTMQLRGTVRACENTPTTSAANACAFGYVPGTGANVLYGQETLSTAQLLNIYNTSIDENTPVFFNGYPGAEGLSSWKSIDLDKFYEQLSSTGNYNFNCMKQCTASDGKVYNQPYSTTSEKITAAYYMAEFEQKLPFDMEFGGNFGVRYVKTEITGQGNVTLSSIRKTAAFNPANPGAAAGITTSSISRPVSLDKTYDDFLPSYNAALWVVPDQVVMRYSWAKTIARPSVSRIWPGGTCTNDERNEGVFDADGSVRDMTCTTFGNPALQPYKATKTNTALEWYPNKDSSFSLAYYRQKVVVGGPITRQFTNIPLFEGTDVTDPVTGQSFADLDFTYTTYINGPAYTQTGWEFASKTALTFLPWKLKYTGVDFNISTTESPNANTYVDPITGEGMDPQNQAKYFANLSLWYDDGTTNIRVAYQARDRVFNCVSACGDNTVRNYPNNNPANFVGFPYNPGEPYYTKAYEYLDAKISYRFNKNVQVYLEGRNLLKSANIVEGSENRGFANGVENPWTIGYGGSKFMFGITYKE